MSVRAETKEEAYDNESANNARKSEAKNVAHVVSRDASSGLIRGQGDGCAWAPATLLIEFSLRVIASASALTFFRIIGRSSLN